jgi:hypothetical protein
LFDAVGKTIKKLEKDIENVEDAAVLVTIITDGEENASQEWTGPAVKALIDHCKEEGWMFSFIGAGENIIKIATKISITNTVLWEQTAQGTADVFANENEAQTRFYDRMACANGCAPDMSAEDRKKLRKKLSENYYKKDDEQSQQ